MKYNNLLQTVGNTPLIKLDKLLSNKAINLFAKLEGQNPGGSIKDRAALFMINKAEQRGELIRGKTILEATSGNMGIALSMIGAQKGYSVHIVMSEAMSQERKTMIQALGAKLILSDKNEGTKGAIKKAKGLINANPSKYWFADQFNNPDNALAYYKTLAPEILKEVERIDYFVAGIGTSGTIMGVAKKIKEISPNTKVIAVIPPKGYLIQGIQDPLRDFAGKVYDSGMIDEFINVSMKDAFNMAKQIGQKEGLFVGASSGAILFVAQQLSATLKTGNIVVIIPDRGEKYLSTELFKNN